MHEESLGFGCDPACHSGLPDYTLSSRTRTWEGAEDVPSPLGRRWSQPGPATLCLFMHHILTSAAEEAPPPPWWASGTALLGEVGHLPGGLQALHSWERWGAGTLPTSPGASCLTHSRPQGDLWPSLHGAPPTQRCPPNETHRPVCPWSTNGPRPSDQEWPAASSPHVGRWGSSKPVGPWQLGERGLPPSSGLLLPYLVLIERFIECI